MHRQTSKHRQMKRGKIKSPQPYHPEPTHDTSVQSAPPGTTRLCDICVLSTSQAAAVSPVTTPKTNALLPTSGSSLKCAQIIRHANPMEGSKVWTVYKEERMRQKRPFWWEAGARGELALPGSEFLFFWIPHMMSKPTKNIVLWRAMSSWTGHMMNCFKSNEFHFKLVFSL